MGGGCVRDIGEVHRTRTGCGAHRFACLYDMKQKVLIVNKFYYPRGGDCVVAMNTEKLLRAHGHETAVFAMDYPDNIDTPWKAYYAPCVDFGASKVAAVKRLMGVGDIRQAFGRILDEFKPDVVHLNNIHSYLSPVVAELAHRHGARVVWTLHDYKLVCPAYTCTRDGRSCEACVTGPKSGVVRHRCLKGSLAASALAWLEAVRWRRSRLEKCTDAFICPSGFMREMMKKAGFRADKMHVLGNFVDPEKAAALKAQVSAQRDSYGCYIGRLSEEKGVRTMLEAASQLPYELRVAGDGPLADELRRQYAGCTNITFLGHLDAAGVARLCSQARFSILASEWCENNPLGVIESLSAGTPAVVSDMGGIPELVAEGFNGVVFRSGDLADLVRAINKAATCSWDNAAIAADAGQRFGQEAHYRALVALYSDSDK